MLDITVIRCFDTRHQNSRCEAMVEGLRKIGINAAYNKDTSRSLRTKKVALWGWRHGAYLHSLGHDVLVMELGYIGDRQNNISLGWNGLNGYAEFADQGSDQGQRFASHGGKIMPWKEGDYALILGQLPGDSSLKGQDMKGIYESWAARINMPVHFRNHPEAIKRKRLVTVDNAIVSEGSLEDALKGAAFSVCYNSNSGVDSVLSGTPAIIFDKGSMAYPVAGHEIGDIITPEREAWAYDLAFKQWTLDEISKGIPLKKLMDMKC